MGNAGIYAGIVLVMIALLLLSFRLSFFLARRSICQVISIFRDFNAVNYTKALTLENLGLSRQFFSFRLLRDYKPWALRTLVQANIIRSAEEGTFYLSEDTLNANPNIQTACQTRIKV